MIESQLRELFDQLADRAAAPSRVDTQLALHQGRAHLRWRRACIASVPVLAAAAVAAIVLAVVVSPFRPAPGPVGGTGSLAPRQFSPLILNVSFGWLPPGQSLGQGGVRPTDAFLTAVGPADPEGWGVGVYARGHCHLTGPATGLTCTAQKPGGFSTQFSGPAPAVAGRSAFWAGPNLIWQYARGGWADLSISVASFSALQQDTRLQAEALKIARHLRVGPATPRLVFPAQLTGLGSHWRINNVHYTADSRAVGADSYLLTTGTSRFFPHVGDLGIWTNAPYFDIHPTSRTATCSPHDPATRNTSETINGYQVVVKQMTVGGHPEQELCAAHAGRLWVDIIEFGRHPSIGVVSLFRQHLRLLGTNPADWTKDPLTGSKGQRPGGVTG